MLPIGEDDGDLFLCLKDGRSAALESHVLKLSADFVSWEEDVNVEAIFECVAITDEVISRVDVNGLENGGRHGVKERSEGGCSGVE